MKRRLLWGGLIALTLALGVLLIGLILKNNATLSRWTSPAPPSSSPSIHDAGDGRPTAAPAEGVATEPPQPSTHTIRLFHGSGQLRAEIAAITSPCAKIYVKTIWKQNQAPVAGTTVSIARRVDETWHRTQALTNAAGMAILTCPEDWPTVAVRAEHIDAATVSERLSLPPSKTLIIPLDPGASLSGRTVSAADDTPVSSATVALFRDSGQPVQTVTSDENGRFEFKNRTGRNLKLFAWTNEWVSDVTAPEAGPYALEPGSRQGPVRIPMDAGRVLRGRVTDGQTNRSIPGVAVRIDYRSRSYEATTDEGGRYRLTGIPDDRITVTTQSDEYVKGERTLRPAADDETVCDFELERGGRIHVLAQDTQAAPIADAQVVLMAGLTQPERLDEDFRTDEDGRTTITGVRVKSPPMVLAVKEGYELMGQMPTAPTFAPGSWDADITLTLPKSKQSGGVFAGRVTDTKGNPIMGAVVRWMSLTPSGRNEAVQTNAEGRYRLKVSGAGMMSRLVAYGQGYAPDERTNLSPGTEEAPTVVDFQLSEGHWLEVTVQDPEGEPIEGVNLIPLKSGLIPLPLPGNEAPQQTDANGKVRFENLAGPQVSIMYGMDGAGAGALGNMERQTFDVDQAVIIVIQPNGVIRGVVYNAETREPIRNFEVTHSSTGFLGLGLPQKNTDVFTSDDGRFELINLRTDKAFSVSVQAPGYTALQKTNLHPTTDDMAPEIEFLLVASDQVRGVVLGPDGQTPVVNANVVFAYYRESPQFDWGQLDATNPFLDGVQSTVTDETGAFAFAEGDEDGSLFILAPGYARRRIRPEERYALPIDSEGRLMILLEPGASVAGLGLSQADGLPGIHQRLLLTYTPMDSPNLLFQYLSDPDSLQLIGSTTTDRNGAYRWDSLPPGAYQISVQTIEQGMGIFALGERFELDAGENRILNLGDGLGPLTLSGRLLTAEGEPFTGGIVTLEPLFDWEYSDFGAISGQEGRYEINGLAPGTYQVTLIQFRLNDGTLSHITKTIDLREDTLRDLAFVEGHIVHARLTFPADTPSEIRNLYITGTLRAVDSNDARRRGVSAYGTTLIQEGRLTFRGNYQGAYRLALTDILGSKHVELEPVFELDNLLGDQDLGDIPAPVHGEARIRIAFDGVWPETPINVAVRLIPVGGLNAPIERILRSDAPDQMARDIPIGDYQVSVQATGYVAAPFEEILRIDPFDAAEINILLLPEAPPGLE